jgi:hypothetical protein
MFLKLNSVDPDVEMSSLFESVDGEIGKEFIDAENRMYSLNIFYGSRAKACINR